MGHADDREVRDPRVPAFDKHRIRHCRVVIAGQDDNWHAGVGEQLAGAVDHRGAQLVGLKSVARQQYDIGLQRPRGRQYRGEPGGAVAVMCRRDPPVVDMDVGAVDEPFFAGASKRRHYFCGP